MAEVIEELRDLRKYRPYFMLGVLILVVAWIVTLICLVLNSANRCRPIPENVLIALITGATAQVVALLGYIMFYLFKSDRIARRYAEAQSEKDKGSRME